MPLKPKTCSKRRFQNPVISKKRAGVTHADICGVASNSPALSLPDFQDFESAC